MCVDVSMSTDLGKHKQTRLPLRSRLPLLVPPWVCCCLHLRAGTLLPVCVQITGVLELIKNTLHCCWRQSTCIMPQSGLSVPAAHSHTRSCANLHWGDIWLHQQVGRSHFRHILSALQRLRSLQNPPRRRSTSLMRRDFRFASNFGSRRQNCRAVAVARLTSASLSRSLGCSTAWAAGAACCRRPGLDSHSPEAPSQLPSFTLSGILPATQEGPPNVYPRDSEQCPQLITATPPPTPTHTPYSPPEETLILIYQWKEVRYSGKGPGEAIN